MLNIKGATYAEVFRNLSEESELTGAEREAARIIAEDIEAQDRWRDESDRARKTIYRDVPMMEWEIRQDEWLQDHPEPKGRHYVSIPVAEARNFEVGRLGVVFHVRPYCPDESMNVGVTSQK